MNVHSIPHERVIVNLKSLFKDLPKYSKKELHHSCPQHPGKIPFMKVITTYPLNKALGNTGLLVFMLNFLNDYNWKHYNFCRSSRKLESRWHTGHRKITKFFSWAYYCGVIEPYGMWCAPAGEKTYLVPVWVLSKVFFDLTPVKVLKWTDKIGFKVRSH